MADQENEALRQRLDAAKRVIRAGGTVNNDLVTVYSENHGDQKVPLIFCLLQEYHIPVSFQTIKWIRLRLKSVTVGANGHISLQYMSVNHGKCSKGIWNCLEALVHEVRS